MKKIKKIEYLGNSLDISIYFNMNCNLKCSYCFAHLANTQMSFENTKQLLQHINNLNNPISIQILGGEPSIYKHIEYFVNNLSSKHDLNFITNGLKTHTLNLKATNNKSVMMFSIHYEYLDDKYINEIIKSIMKYSKTNFHLSASVNIPEFNKLEKYENRLLEVISRINSLDANVMINPNTLIIDSDLTTITDKNLIRKEKNFKNKIKAIVGERNIDFENENMFKMDGSLINRENLTTIYEDLNKNRRFKNKCLCNLGFMEIGPDGVLKYICTHEKISSLGTDFFIPEEPKKTLCPNKICNHHCYMTSTKRFL